MSVGITISNDTARPALRRLLAALADRTPLNRSIATAAENLTRAHLIRLAATRHKTARRLGATPTGHLGRAAENVTSEADADAATVGITSPGISRVAGPVTIRPVNGNWLTIPMHRLAYGRTVRQVEKMLNIRLFRPGRKNNRGRVLAAVEKDTKKLVPFFALSKAVTLRQDRTLVPTDRQYLQAANRAAWGFVRAVLKGREQTA